MDQYDVRLNIMLNEPDVQQLRHHCSIDNMSRQICSRRAFWINLFKNQGLIMTDKPFSSPEEWFIEYEKELVIKNQIDRLLVILNQVSEIYFNSDNISFNQDIFNNIDSQIGSLYNQYLILKYKNLIDDHTPPPQGVLFIDPHHMINIVFLYATNTHNLKNYNYIIDHQMLIHILHFLLEHGVQLYDADMDNVL